GEGEHVGRLDEVDRTAASLAEELLRLGHVRLPRALRVEVDAMDLRAWLPRRIADGHHYRRVGADQLRRLPVALVVAEGGMEQQRRGHLPRETSMLQVGGDPPTVGLRLTEDARDARAALRLALRLRRIGTPSCGGAMVPPTEARHGVAPPIGLAPRDVRVRSG